MMETLLKTVDHHSPEFFILNCSRDEIVKKLNSVVQDNAIISSYHSLQLDLDYRGTIPVGHQRTC